MSLAPIIALLNPRDQTHDISRRVSKGLTGYRIVTTEEVLTEVLNDFGARTVLSRGRHQAGGADAGGPFD